RSINSLRRCSVLRLSPPASSRYRRCVSACNERRMGEALTHTPRCGTKHTRLLISLLGACVLLCLSVPLLILTFTGVLGSVQLNSTLLALNQTLMLNPHTPQPRAAQTLRAEPSTSFEPRASASPSIQSESAAARIKPTATDLSPIPTTELWTAIDSPQDYQGLCSQISDPGCQILPYNLSTESQRVKASDRQIFIRFFSYLNRLSCYRHIMLFGCMIAYPQCSTHRNDSNVILPCRSFCEAAQIGCEPVLQMLNASWPEFLRCSQFSNSTEEENPNTHTPLCFTPRATTGRSSLCVGGDHFLCATGICVPQKLVCNGFNDCGDWSDEQHCACADDLHRCGTGRCIPPHLLCDGYDDCGDLSDEHDCVCDEAEEHCCGDGRCIPRLWICDGDHDCADKSDEHNCSCQSQGLVECRNQECIPESFRCDGENDCRDGSDEENCTHTHDQGVSCSSCVGGSSCVLYNCSACEPITMEICGGVSYNLTKFPNFLGHTSQGEASRSWASSLFPALVQTHCAHTLMFFACTLLAPKCDPHTHERVPPCRSLCSSSKERCESVLGIVGLQWPEDTDCSQFPDDAQGNTSCLLADPNVNECSPSHFRCVSGRCVLSSKRCDGHKDCDDSSDEENCGCVERGLWECPGDKLCIKHSMICDGFPDCNTEDDEKNCSVMNLSVKIMSVFIARFGAMGEGIALIAQTSGSLSVYKAGVESHVCVDGWNPHLGNITCAQMGLGFSPSSGGVFSTPVLNRTRWLHFGSNYSPEEQTLPLQRLLHKQGQSCQSFRKVSLQCKRDECGRRVTLRMVKRILGGRASRPGQWPWQCSLQSDASGPSQPRGDTVGHVCGCVLIGVKWALTVAHCFEGRENPSLWKVVMGINNLDHPSSHAQTRRVRSVITHSRYNRAVVDYDISLVELESEVTLTPFVRPVCLPQPGQLPQSDQYCYITGWGHAGHHLPFKLQEGPVRIISESLCQSYFDMKTITSRMLCAGYEAGTIDSCMGDSGGPLVCEDQTNHWTLFGLTSWGSVCVSKLLGPGVYANVTHFTEWIQRQIYLRSFNLLDMEIRMSVKPSFLGKTTNHTKQKV
ncbi:hypothetical protein DNTS_009657, partial [Danionella cerebrum]